MVNTTEITPSPPLQPFVQHFAYREFDTLGVDLCRPLPAMHEFLITFNLGMQPVEYKTPAGGEKERSKACAINADTVVSGINDHFTGIIRFKGHYRLFSIHFRPNGFYRIFGMPAALFTNQIEEGWCIFNKDINTLQQQLQESVNVQAMVRHSEHYLVSRLMKSKAKDPYNCIQSVSDLLLHSNSNIPVEKLAFEANMSMKTFERKFTEQIGVSPKLFARMVRFNKALVLKVNDPKQSWTCIAHTCGYFDQMHFIKDFKLFTGETPTTYLKNLPPPKEHFVKEK
ncbi:MAG: AraC family transcriptional regulator [Flavisolibacter sp.]|nr:AraC family transcriptional regulator [Flavisolibacter sp.]